MGRGRPPPCIALGRRQGSNPDLLAESELQKPAARESFSSNLLLKSMDFDVAW